MSIEDDIALLDRVPTLKMLGLEALRIIAIGAESRVVRGGDILFREGQEADSAYVVVSGNFALTREDMPPEAGQPRAVNVGPGTLLGEMALITQTQRPATATATEVSSVLRIPRSIFMRTVESYPDVALRLARTLSERLTTTLDDLGRVRMQFESIEPVARRLPEESGDEPEPDSPADPDADAGPEGESDTPDETNSG
ncbi:Crp/Fnr family transcriptional regulator [Bosea sp. 117]|uniref:cyclic nucleotide-binding domain-containing protein n=1 Tax=Bosea sp. 117 TaxID=1125973 RepID=UPI0009DCD955|nr:Crp/Fnr family transcriptional regulator [Bosea sp. 117]